MSESEPMLSRSRIPEVPSEDETLPTFTTRALCQYEGVFFTQPQLDRCEELLKEKTSCIPIPSIRHG